MISVPEVKRSCRNCAASRGDSAGGLRCASTGHSPAFEMYWRDGTIIKAATRSRSENQSNDRRCEQFADTCGYYRHEGFARVFKRKSNR